jgi:hypothetical protein
MRLIDCFYPEGMVDCYTLVFDERDPWTNYYTMLATDDHDGRVFSQWTAGFYEPGEANPHLGERPRLIGETLLHHVIGRMQDAPSMPSSVRTVTSARDDL